MMAWFCLKCKGYVDGILVSNDENHKSLNCDGKCVDVKDLLEDLGILPLLKVMEESMELFGSGEVIEFEGIRHQAINETDAEAMAKKILDAIKSIEEIL